MDNINIHPLKDGLVVEVHDGNVDGAMKMLKRRMLTNGIFKEMKKRSYYMSPSERRRRKSIEARKKLLKKQRRRTQEERAA